MAPSRFLFLKRSVLNINLIQSIIKTREEYVLHMNQNDFGGFTAFGFGVIASDFRLMNI